MTDPPVFLSTERLVLRQLTGSDVDNLHELDSDPQVMRYLTGGVATAYQQIRDELLPGLLAEYHRGSGLGRWAAVDRAGGEFLGWFALRMDPEGPPDEAELGYRLRRRAWGQGLATEGSRALIAKGFNEFGLRRIFAQTMAVNIGSRRVMERSGLTLTRVFHPHFDDPIPGTELGEVEYEIRRK